MSTAVGHWTVKEYDEAVAAGIFGDAKIELLQGEIYPTRDIGEDGSMTPIGPRHSNTLRYLRTAAEHLGPGIVVGVQDPVTLGDHSEPQPDLWLARRGLYSTHHPTAEDLLLVVEVADSSLRRDRRKARIYVEAGVPEVWVVNLQEAGVEVSRPPGPGPDVILSPPGTLAHASGLSVDLAALFDAR